MTMLMMMSARSAQHPTVISSDNLSVSFYYSISSFHAYVMAAPWCDGHTHARRKTLATASKDAVVRSRQVCPFYCSTSTRHTYTNQYNSLSCSKRTGRCSLSNVDERTCTWITIVPALVNMCAYSTQRMRTRIGQVHQVHIFIGLSMHDCSWTRGFGRMYRDCVNRGTFI